MRVACGYNQARARAQIQDPWEPQREPAAPTSLDFGSTDAGPKAVTCSDVVAGQTPLYLGAGWSEGAWGQVSAEMFTDMYTA